MRFVNVAEHRVSVEMDGVVITCEPGGSCEIRDEYARPGVTAGGGRRPSVVEMLAPQLKPADMAARSEWEKVPGPVAPPAPKVITAADLVAEGMAPAVAEHVAAAKAEAATVKPARKGKAK